MDGWLQVDRQVTLPLPPHLTGGHFGGLCGNPEVRQRQRGQITFYWWKSQLSGQCVCLLKQLNTDTVLC